MIKGKYIFKSNGKVIAEKDNLITTNGFLMINRYLAQSSIDWAGTLCVGALNTAPAISDKTLYYEMSRVPVTLKSYTKINPKYIVTNKQLATTAATIKFKSSSTPSVDVGYTVQVSGVDTLLDGTWKILTLTVITQPTPTTLGEYQITYTTSNAGTIASTAVTSSTALITAKLDASNNNVYNNEIIIKAALDPDLAMQINEVGVIPLNIYNNVNKDNFYLSDFSEISTSDTSKSQWTISSSQVNLQGTANIQGSNINPTGYLWNNGSNIATFNVSNTYGMKVGNSVYISGASTSLSAAKLNSSSGNGSVMTYVAASAHGLITGQTVTITGFSTTGYNVTGTVTVTSATQFTIPGSATGGTGPGTFTPGIWSMTGTVYSINGNYQVAITMPYTNTYSANQGGYGGTISINSTTQSQPSNFGLFNILLTGGSTATLTGLATNLTNYNSSDRLMVLYYANGTMSGKTISVVLTDSNANTYTCTSASLSSTTAGWYATSIPLTGFPSTGATISTIAVSTSSGSSNIFLDGLKLISNSYWTAHPYSAASTIYLAPEYQLTSRSIFTSPVIKYAGQQMDIEYHIQVT